MALTSFQQPKEKTLLSLKFMDFFLLILFPSGEETVSGLFEESASGHFPVIFVWSSDVTDSLL